MVRPFIIYALPRSRTAWLSAFLSYGDVTCGHEQAIFMRDVSDIAAYFSRPNTGAVETAAAQGWKIIHHHVPNIRAAVIRRPTEQVIDSMMNADLRGLFRYERKTLAPVMEYGNRMLDQVARQPGVLSLEFSDLDTEAGCAAIFEHCLERKFDRQWWLGLREKNIQVDIPDMISYYHCNKDAIMRFKSLCRSELRRLFVAGEISSDRGARCLQ